MRKYQKRQCLELVKTLEEAQETIRKNIESRKIEAAFSLLEQCQQGAIRLGTFVEQLEGEGTKTVQILEAYCDRLFQFYQKLTQEAAVNAKKMQKELKQILFAVSDSIENDLRTQIEIVFLPYKASMWDSMESVWKAAEEDPDCAAYVIPIPYYDKNLDGSFAAEHYEGNQYPKDVPVLPYNSYDFEARRPDRIYIHNPYDGLNYVTSVPPFFYSENLKEFTEELIYIPYFVLEEPNLKNEKVPEWMTHFVVVPAVIHADKVIVQSENMREAYIRILTEQTGKETRKYWEKKIDGSGSPKFDRVENLSDTDYELPEEWRRIIEGKGKTRKKVVFYNTSLNAILQNGEAMLKKIEKNLEIFKSYQEDIVLLWRPHPLMEATLTSMRPQLWQKYKEISGRYRKEGWGIYDETAELYRAIAVSDAYYGDRSSVVELYQRTGKPIMIQGQI